MRTLILIVTLSLSQFLRAQETMQMSLDDCIEYALGNSEQLKIAQLENDIATTQVNETLARGLPQVNGNVGVTKNFEIQVTPIPDFISPAVYGVLLEENLLPDNTQIPAPQTLPAAFGTDYSGQAVISASQLIFDGSYFVGLKAARTVKKLSQKQQAQTEVEIVEAVSKAYYLVLISHENVEFLGENFAKLDTLLRETNAMYANGFAEKIDVSRLKIQHNNLKTELKNSTELLITSLNLLKFQMGMAVDQPISLSETLADVETMTLESNATASASNRPEYEVLQTNKELIELNIKNFKTQYLPNIYANFNLGWIAGTDSFGDLTQLNDQNWFRFSNLGVSMNIPIFDGLSKKAIIQRNKVQLDQINLGIQQFENNVQQEVIRAKISSENATRSVESQKDNVELAEEVYDITTIKYQEGVGSNLEVVDANTSLKEAQTNYLNALYEAITAQIDLKKALGTLHNKN